jgi:cell division protein FtsL
MAISILFCFFIFLWARLYVLDIGYQISRTAAMQENLIQTNKKLKIERAALRRSSRIESIARKKLGMVTPQSKQIVVLQW